MSDLFGNHIVGFPTRRLISVDIYAICKKDSSTNFTDTTLNEKVKFFLKKFKIRIKQFQSTFSSSLNSFLYMNEVL